MNFKFKVQQYQTEAVKAVLDVFQGQGKFIRSFRRDMGTLERSKEQGKFDTDDEIIDGIGYRNNEIHLSDEELLNNIQNTLYRISFFL